MDETRTEDRKTHIYFYCYSIRLYHFLCSMNEKCYASKINQNSRNRYWVFYKSERLDRLIEAYNEIKHKY